MVRISWTLLLVVIACTPLIASSVEQVSMAEVAKGAELIFRGRVLEARSIREGTGAIFTHVTFQIIEVYKGPNVGDRIELDFMGGRWDAGAERRGYAISRDRREWDLFRRVSEAEASPSSFRLATGPFPGQQRLLGHRACANGFR